jgi:putative ABC transport system permease protein
MLRVQPASGRVFLPEEDVVGGNRVVVVSHGLWQRRFGSDPNLVSRSIRIDGENYTVIGIMPADFKFPLQAPADLWTPVTPYVDQNARGFRFLSVIARLKPNITLEHATAEMNTIARRLEQEYPNNRGWGVNVVSLHQDLTKRARPALLLLLGVVAFVLLIACANVANLLLARAAARQKEIAIRVALGASRIRLVRQLLTESLILALLSGGLGFLIAVWAMNILVASMPDVPTDQSIGLDVKVLVFTLLISVAAAAFFGLVPALQASKPDLNKGLKESSRSAGGGFGGRRRMRNLLVIAEVAVSLMLLIGAGMMMKSFLNLRNVDPGFDAKNVLVVPVSLPQNKYPENEQRGIFFQQAIRNVGSLPGVESVGATSMLPLGGEDRANSFAIEGRAPLAAGERIYANTREVTPDYFRTMRIPLRKGRTFTEQDSAAAPLVIVVNETMVRRFFPSEDPIGKRITLSGPEGPWFNIVGVVGDVRHSSLSIEPGAEMYGPHLQDPLASMHLVIRTKTDPQSLVAAVRKEIVSMDKDIPASGIKTMEQALTSSIAPVRTSLILLSLFAVLAVVLATMGVFAFMSYSVTQRVHEIGVRMALGAHQSDVLKLIVGQGMKLVLIGIGVGILGGALLSRIMMSALYGVSAIDPVTFAGVSLLLAVVALLAILIPARRAMKVDPMIALRYE